MIKVDRFYLQELTKASFKDRFLFLMFNEYRVDWEYAFPCRNPMDWSIRDLLRLVAALTWIVVRPFFRLFEARKIKHKYGHDYYRGVFQPNVTLPYSLAQNKDDSYE